MPNPGSGSTGRPKRNCTLVPTYNLKILNDNAHHTHLHASNRQIRNSTGHLQPCQRSTGTNMDSLKNTVSQHFFDEISSSPLASLINSPRTSPVTVAPAHVFDEASARQHTVAKLPLVENKETEFECFNTLTSARGHYYSAHTLKDRGVWVGYLAPDKHKKQFSGMPSFHDLKTNFTDMALPFPPTNEATSANNRNAVCRGCFGPRSALLTLCELQFVHNRKVVIMPLDGNDELGMFCILLPQPRDRSIKNLQIWRPYEVRNGGDGKKFDNKFILLSLRDTLQDFGTLEVMRAALCPQDVAPVMVRTASPVATASRLLVPLSSDGHPRRRVDLTDAPRHEGSEQPTAQDPGDDVNDSGDGEIDNDEGDSGNPEKRVIRSRTDTPPLKNISRVERRQPREHMRNHARDVDEIAARSPAPIHSIRAFFKPQPSHAKQAQTKRYTPVSTERSHNDSTLTATMVQEQPVAGRLEVRPNDQPAPPSLMELVRDRCNPFPRMSTARKRPLDLPEAESSPSAVLHRAMTKSAEPQTPPTKRAQTQRCTPVPTESPNDLPPRTATTEEVLISQSSKQSALPGMTEQQAQDISIVWKLDIDGDTCELPVTLAECRSFSGVLQTLREVAQSLAPAAAILEKSNLWRLTYPLAGGKRKKQVARKGTEVAFDRMRADLAQLSSLNQGMIEVELEALG